MNHASLIGFFWHPPKFVSYHHVSERPPRGPGLLTRSYLTYRTLACCISVLQVMCLSSSCLIFYNLAILAESADFQQNRPTHESQTDSITTGNWWSAVAASLQYLVARPSWKTVRSMRYSSRRPPLGPTPTMKTPSLRRWATSLQASGIAEKQPRWVMAFWKLNSKGANPCN